MTDRRAVFIWQMLGAGTVLLFFMIYGPARETRADGFTGDDLLAVVNQDRISAGLAPLEANSLLEKAAADKALDMLRRSYFAHTSPAGLHPWDFIKSVGFAYSFAGENLALNYTSSYELENDFLQSPSHRENLLSPLFSDIGIAIVPGKYLGKPAVITVLMFGAQSRSGQKIAQTD